MWTCAECKDPKDKATAYSKWRAMHTAAYAKKVHMCDECLATREEEKTWKCYACEESKSCKTEFTMLSAEQRAAQYRKKCDSCRQKDDGGKQGDHVERKPDDCKKEGCTEAGKDKDDAAASSRTGCAANRTHEKEMRCGQKGQQQENAEARERRQNSTKKTAQEGQRKRSTKAEEVTKRLKTDSIWCYGCESQRPGEEFSVKQRKELESKVQVLR